MSNHAEFIILVGTGHPYGGEGMIINDILSLHDHDGWFFAANDCSSYWLNSSMEDALLMISLYCIAPRAKGDSPFARLRKKAEASFTVPLSGHDIDTDNDMYISKEALQSLYDENKRLLSSSSVKLVGLRLRSNCLQGIAEDRLKKEFLATVMAYNLNNVEYCETVYGRFCGSFSQTTREYVKKGAEDDENI